MPGWGTGKARSHQRLLLDTQSGDSAEGATYYINPGETLTPEDIGITASVVSTYSRDQSIEWKSSAESVISIDPTTGQMTGMQPGGSATITARHNFNGAYSEAYVTIVVKAVADGVYYIKNRAFDKYMQISADEAPHYSSSNAVMEQWRFDGGEYQKWAITWLDNGYYSIISVKSGMALSVSIDSSGELDALLVQKEYSGSYRQQWEITMTDDHCYKIKARSSKGLSSDLVMMVGYSTTDDLNGTVISQRVYTEDAFYKDEWKLYPVETDVFLLGVNASEDGHDHYSVYGSVMPDIQSLGYDGFNCIVTDGISVSETQDYMKECKIFVSRGHGSYSTDRTFIALDKDADEFLGTWDIYFYLIDEATIDLSSCDLAIFVGCYTAAVEGTSLPDAAAKAGASYAIGFRGQITCDEANQWTRLFFWYYKQGASVQVSAQRAADDCNTSSWIQSFYLATGE